MELKYNIISSSSSGNALILNDCVMIDCGVSYSKIKQYIRDIKIILLTHL